MSKDTCINVPDAPNGEPSRLYRNLLKKIKNRPLVNWIYSCYRSSLMQHLGETNRQGEHSMEEVLANVDYSAITDDVNRLFDAEVILGAKDSMGNIINHTNAEEALKKVDDFNKTHKGLVATVNQHGSVFNISVFSKQAGTNTLGDIVEAQLKAWDIYKQAFSAKGVDITNLPQEVQRVVNACSPNVGEYLRSLSNLSIQNTFRNQALILFSLNPNSQHIQNIVNKFGSIEKAAQAIDDYNRGNTTLTPSEQTLLVRALRDAKKFSGVDMDALINQVNQATNNIKQNSKEQTISDELAALDKKYHIDVQDIYRKTSKINALSEAAQEACVVLERQIKELQRKQGNTADVKKLKIMQDQMFKELQSKHYSFGVLQFLNEAANYINNIPKVLDSIPRVGTTLEVAMETSRTLQHLREIYEQYNPIIEALANNSLSIDESINPIDIENLRNIAKDLKEILDKYKNQNHDLMETNMIHILENILPGKQGPNGETIANLVKMAVKDSNYFDYFYRKDTHSNPTIAAMGTILKRAQEDRDNRLNKIDLRIRRATNKLYDSGHNSEFMYEDNGHIVSDIDWNAYNKARINAAKSYKAQGLKGFDFKQAMENWKEQNTEDRIVDKTNGRTERVPNFNYRKHRDFKEGWTNEQMDYYDEMMQLKGEIGSLLPDYAQEHYLPPQLRREMIDALKHSKSAKDILKAFKTKVQDLYKVREDDTTYAKNGSIDGKEYQYAEGDAKNNLRRDIPIFFVSKVEQGELLRNFSAGLIALASTAVNYDAMNNIKDTVELMADFITSQNGVEGNGKAEFIEHNETTLIKEIYKRGANTNTVNIVYGMLSMQLYGNKHNPNANKTFDKIASSILQYTSFKGLSTNFKGAVANGLMGEFQMMIEAGCGEFYGWRDFMWAHTRLFGKAGFAGEMMNLLTNNVNSKSCLLREKFDPVQDNFSELSHKKYYKSAFRQLISKDCSFIGYGVGEDVIHYVNMFSVLHHEKVLLNGEKTSLYDAYEVTPKVDGNSELVIKQGATRLDGSPITEDYILSIKGLIAGVNSNCHGSMRDEDKGIIHQRMLGRCIMNFRQWMVEHYARRFRGRHFDANFNDYREGYWYSLYKGLFNEDTKDEWKYGHKLNAVGLFMKDLYNFAFRSSTHWHNLKPDQKANIKRVRTEIMLCLLLATFDCYLGEPDEHKKEWFRRFCIYQNKRMLMDELAAMPFTPRECIYNTLNILNSPMACISTIEGLLYLLKIGDLNETIQTGKHKGENKYWRNVKKYVLPFYKDYEQMQEMSTSDAIFKPFKFSLGNH